MAYDQKRLNPSNPEWHDALVMLVAGLNAEVLSFAELVDGLGSDVITRFLDGYFGARVPLTVLRAFVRRSKRSALNDGKSQYATYKSLHNLARRKRHPFFAASVAVGRVRRGEKFCWQEDTLDGLERIRVYLASAPSFCSDVAAACYTNYGRFRLLHDLRVRFWSRPFVEAADFVYLRAIASAVSALPLDPLDVSVNRLPFLAESDLGSLQEDYRSLSSALAKMQDSQLRSDLLTSIQWTSAKSPQSEWLKNLSAHFSIRSEVVKGKAWLIPT